MTSSSDAVRVRNPSVWTNPLLWGLALPAVVFFAQAIYLWGFTIDDVAISYRYAQHLADGRGLTWNAGGSPVEGFSNFLWVLILAGVKWIGLDIETAAMALGVGLGMACLFLLFLLCRRLWFPQRFWWLPVLLVASTPEWVMWIISGLEIALYCSFLLLSLLGLTSEHPQRRRLLMVALPGLVLTRPEGLAMAAVILCGGLLAESGTARERIAVYAAPILTVLGTALALLIFRLAYFGSPLPNTVYAKFTRHLQSLRLVGAWLLFGIPFLLLWGAAFRRIRSQRYPWVLGASIAMVMVQMAVVLPVVPVMYFLHRYQIALLPFLVLAVPSFNALVSKRKRWVSAAVFILMLAWTLKEWPQVTPWVASEKYWKQTRREVAQALSSMPRDAKVALIDAGFIPYWTDLPTLDVWGLCDRTAARQGFSAEAVMEENPEVYVMMVHVDVDGRVGVPQGRDRMISRTTAFREKYGLWGTCGRSRRDKEGPCDQYVILLDTAWAQARGIPLLASQ